MTKFQKIQRWICIIPFLSTLFVVVTTYLSLYRVKAKRRFWIQFALICACSILTTFIINEYVMSGKFLFLNFIASFAVMTFANFLLIELQSKVGKDGTVNEVGSNDKSALVIVICLSSVLVIVGIIFVGLRIYDGVIYHKQNTIADTNGPNDYSLNSITMKKIETTLSDYTIQWFGESFEGEKTNIDIEGLEDYDCDRAYMQAKSYSGVRTLQATRSDKNSLKLSVVSAVKSGNFGIFVFVDGEYYCDVNINSSEEITLENIADKTVLVKAVGESANIMIEITRE